MKARYLIWLAVSLSLAVLTTWLPISYDRYDPNITLGFLLFLLWVASLIVGGRLFGKRALWALVGVPAAGFWLFAFAFIGISCAVNTAQCP